MKTTDGSSLLAVYGRCCECPCNREPACAPAAMVAAASRGDRSDQFFQSWRRLPSMLCIREVRREDD